MDELERALGEIEEKIEAGEVPDAYRDLLGVLGYPAGGLETAQLFSRAAAALSLVTRSFGAAELADAVARIAAAPDDVEALYDAGYGLYEQRQFAIAATLLDRANRLAPGQAAIITELATCLEPLLLNGPAALLIDASGTAERDSVCAYLSGFHWLMSGDLEVPRRRLQQLEGVEVGPIPFLRGALAGMLARADAIVGAGIPLDDRALTAWQAVISGSLLLHESPHGHDEPMHGRYAFVCDSPALMRQGIDRLAGFLDDTGQRPSRVVAAPGRPGHILAIATSTVLGLPCVDWAPGTESEGLVVAWTLEDVDDVGFLNALDSHAPRQRLFVHASRWTEPFAYAPDVTTLLYQTITNPWTGGALRIDPETRSVTRAEPDTRDDAILAAEIVAADDRDESVTSVEQVLAVARVLAELEESLRPGFHRSHGRRHHQRAGGPVSSSRFS